ncbi:hypothetical protein QLX08_010933 [Tetragonisca angustula]|uniref:Rho-GAP domain-containing protein n=2 Tax=Tetragonisca angustula TaxID=166442 RepID=A0AAW0ZAN7_9HYME
MNMLIYDVLHKERVYHSIVSDLRNYGVKYRFKKNMFKTESSEGKRISKKVFKTPLLYQPLDVVNLSSGAIVHVPVFVSQASIFLEKYITQEGLFRKAGSQLRQKELITRLDNGGSLGEKHHAIDVANCLKTFFRDLPEPLIPYTYHDLFVHCVMLKTYCVQALLLACILLPPHNLNTLAFFMEFLKKVAIYEKQNKMSIDNLAKVVGPNIMPLQVTTMSAVQMRLELHLIVIKILIENAESIGILPDHITQAISMETIGSTDNELDVSDHLRSKFKRKKHRSGSLTRKPHLSASNLNLRMFNGLKKIVGKNAVSEDGNVCDDQRISENSDSMHISSTKSTKKRKVDYADLPSIKKKRVIDKTDKSKKIRLSLDRFVLRKPKTVDESTESCASIFDTETERRWSSVCGSCDSQRTYRAYSDSSSHLKLILKDSEVSNELKEYNNMFGDVDVNLSDDNDEQVLLTKNDIKSSEWHPQLNSSSRDDLDNYDERCAFPLKRRLTVNNFETYSHVQVTSVDNQSEEYVTIPKSEYEEIKNRVSAIESRLSQELKCVNNENNEQNDDLLLHSVKKVQTAYEKTLEEASIETTVSTDYLAKKLGKELKIRRSDEHKIIRSPSARKIGSLRRRSQERMMSKRVRRTASWHISRGSDLQSHIQPNQDLSNANSHNEKTLLLNYTKDTDYLRPISTSLWEEEKNNIMLNNVGNELKNSNVYPKKFSQSSLQSVKDRTHTTVRRVSSFHGNELTNTTMYPNNTVEKLKKTNSQQNMSLNNTPVSKSKSEGKKKTVMSWKDADGYFKSTNQTNTPVTQTGRASIAKLRTQNAGMVLAKAKLFDECTAKTYSQNAFMNKKNDLLGIENDQCTNITKQNCEGMELHRRSSKNIKNRNSKTVLKHPPCSMMEIECKKEDVETCRNIPRDSVVRNTATHQKENKTSPVVQQVPMNTMLQDSRLTIYKVDNNSLCKTPHIKKPLTVKTPRSGKALVRRPLVDSRRTPLKAVGQLGTPKYQSPKSILKTPRN